MTAFPVLFGILNVTEDSFSDGGRFLAPDAAIAHAQTLANAGADVIDIGAASSNPRAKDISAEIEIARLAPVVDALKRSGVAVSVDSFSPTVQRWAIERNVDYLNDVRGFAHPEIYEHLAASRCKLVVMHAVQQQARAGTVPVEPEEVLDRIFAFFDGRLARLAAAGIVRGRLILDPGMGLFLGSRTDASFAVLRGLPRIKQAFGLPVLVSVSRKSFLRRLTGRSPLESGAATLAAELFAADRGADHIRTHDPGALKDALVVRGALLAGS